MFRKAVSLLSIPVTLALSLPAQEGGWTQDFAAAKARAKAEQKHLLLDFTGSDWCGWCIKLDKEVFSQAAFADGAPQQFVLVKLDFPRDESLVTAETKEQNEKLQKQYGVRGYPTILLTDAEGRPYAQTGYQRGGAEKYMEMLGGMKKQGDAFVAAMLRADGKQGAERAAALDEALGLIDEEVVGAHHLSTMEEIVALDADGKANLKAKYEKRVREIALQRDIEREAEAISEAIQTHMQNDEADKAIAHLDALAKAPANKVQHHLALFFKGMVIMDTKQDVKTAIESLEAAKAVLPTSPVVARIDHVLKEWKKQAEDSGDEKAEGGERGQ